MSDNEVDFETDEDRWWPIWWDAADSVLIELHDGRRIEADRSDVELLTWGVSVTSGMAWPRQMVRTIRMGD